MEFRMLFFLLTILVSLSYCDIIKEAIKECTYTDDICEIDAGKCHDLDGIGEYGNFYCGSSVWYEPNAEKFTAGLEINGTERHTGNFTFSVMSPVDDEKTKTSTVYVAKECCNLRLEEPCHLRPDEAPSRWVFVFKYEAGAARLYCSKEIDVRSAQDKNPTVETKGRIPWCEENGKAQRPCLRISDGTFKIERDVEDTNMDGLELNATYYFFEAAWGYASRGKFIPGQRVKRYVSDIEMRESTDVAYVGGEKISTIAITTDTAINAVPHGLKNRTCEMWCYFVKYEEILTESASCYINKDDYEYQGKCQDLWWIVVIAIAALIAVGIALFIVSKFAVSKVKHCFPDASEAEKYIPSPTKDILISQPDLPFKEKIRDEADVCKIGDMAYNVGAKSDKSDMNNVKMHTDEKAEVFVTEQEMIDHAEATDFEDMVRRAIDIATPVEGTDVQLPHGDADSDGYSKKNTERGISGLTLDSGFGTTAGSGLSSNLSVGSDFRGCSSDDMRSSVSSNISEESQKESEPLSRDCSLSDEGIETSSQFEHEREVCITRMAPENSLSFPHVEKQHLDINLKREISVDRLDHLTINIPENSELDREIKITKSDITNVIDPPNSLLDQSGYFPKSMDNVVSGNTDNDMPGNFPLTNGYMSKA